MSSTNEQSALLAEAVGVMAFHGYNSDLGHDVFKRMFAELSWAISRINNVVESAQSGLADCDDDCDMSALWILEMLRPQVIT